MKKLIAGLALILSTAACAPTYRADVSSFSAPGFDPQLVHAIVATSEAQQNSLEFTEYSLEATRAMAAAGLRIDNDNPNRQVAVTLDYSVSEPQTTFATVSEPITGQVGTRIAQRPIGGGGVVTQVSPVYGTVGYRDVPVAITEYTKHLVITGSRYAERRQGAAPQLWKVEVANTSRDNDLRGSMPGMLAAAVPYFGKSSGALVTSTATDEDGLITYIKTGTRPAQ